MAEDADPLIATINRRIEQWTAVSVESAEQLQISNCTPSDGAH